MRLLKLKNKNLKVICQKDIFTYQYFPIKINIHNSHKCESDSFFPAKIGAR